MKKKLTLSIDESVTRRAKRLAQREGTSVSEIVEKYLAEKTAEETGWKPAEGSWTARLLGVVPQSQEDYKQIKEEEILKKYGG
jgi:hypothetical protein